MGHRRRQGRAPARKRRLKEVERHGGKCVEGRHYEAYEEQKMDAAEEEAGRTSGPVAIHQAEHSVFAEYDG